MMTGSHQAMHSPSVLPQSADIELSDVEARVAKILDWLARPAAADLRRELRIARGRLSGFFELALSINQFHRILDLFQSRADYLAAALKRRMREHEQAPTRDLHHLAQDVDDLERQVFEGYLRVLKDIEHRLVRNRRRDPTVVAARGLKALRERLELAAYVAKPAPAEVWSHAHSLYRISRTGHTAAEASATAAAEAGRSYREMLAFAAIQPERLSATEVAGAVDYLGRFAPALVILDQPPPGTDYRLFWVDAASDSPPNAMARKRPEPEQEVLYFSCIRLGTLAAEHLRELEAGTAPAQLQLPPEAAQAAFHGLLLLLHEAWAEPPTRHLLRRRHRYQVSMVVGIEALARLFAGGAATPADLPAPDSDWTVLNESPSGYALLHAAGDAGTVKTGEAVAIRAGPHKPWDICIVRRVFNEGAGKVEIGLQIIASSARAIRVAFRHTPTPQDAVAGLWLPALPALRIHDAIMVPSGTAASQRFVMASGEGRVRVAQGRVVNVDLRTASVDLLEFQDDPYPL